jgi:hypothetical protein
LVIVVFQGKWIKESTMFSTIDTLKRMSIIAATAILASCGGGGSATGGATEFSVAPSSFTLTAGKGNTFCNFSGPNYPGTLVTIVGGEPPYRIVNSVPQWLAVSDSVLTGKNPSFTVVSTGGCGSDLSILILDKQSRSITFTFEVVAGEEAT